MLHQYTWPARVLDLSYIERRSSGRALSPWKTPTASFPAAADIRYKLLDMQ
jgi:hypothetical protein